MSGLRSVLPRLSDGSFPPQLPVAVLVAVLIAGCAPLASFRPANPLVEGRSMELGLGSVALSPRPYVDEPWKHVGQMWLTGQLKPWLQLSGITAFDAEAFAAGGAVKFLFVRADRFSLGAETELGYAWGSFGVPFAFRLFDQTWIYASPRGGNLGIEPLYGFPVGLSVRAHRSLFARVEYQNSWVKFLAYEHRTHLGAALAVQW